MCRKLCHFIWGIWWFHRPNILKLWKQESWPFSPGWDANITRIRLWTFRLPWWQIEIAVLCLPYTVVSPCMHGLVSDRNSVSAESIGRNHWYRYRFRSRNLFSRNRNCIFLEFVHFNSFNRVANKKKRRERKKSREIKKVSNCKKELKKAIFYKCM